METVRHVIKKYSSGRVAILESVGKTERQFTLFPELPAELRLKIWAFCYLLPQPPRIVEVRTQKHDNCPAHEGFCPRFSPSKKPTLVNTCREARAAACSEALKVGHLIFKPSSSLEPIIFNPTIDLLYLPSESLPRPRIRAPLGTWTQFKKHHNSPSVLRFLAVDMERYGSQFNPMRCAIYTFPNLRDIFFFSPDWERAKQVEDPRESLRVMQKVWARNKETSRDESTVEGMEEGQGENAVERKWPRVRLVVKGNEGPLGGRRGHRRILHVLEGVQDE